MTAPRPFFLLVGRASVFWLGATGLIVVSMTVAGLAQPDDRLHLYVDAVFLAAFAFPACSGWLAGAVIQELQHTSFAALLPDVRPRVASGFLTAGLAITAIVVAMIALAGDAPRNLPLLFVVGIGAYCFGGTFIDPLSNWITGFNVILALLVIAGSSYVARIAEEYPWLTVLVALGIGSACAGRLFARSTFRRKPSRATSPLPGRFSLERAREYQSRRRVEAGPRKRRWRSGYLGGHAWRWVRAAIHESHGAVGWRDVAKILNPLACVVLLAWIIAWAERGETGIGGALAGAINDALFRSPYQPVFGEKGGPFPLVAIAIAAAGVTKALFAPVALNGALAYPLSRRQRASVHFRGGLVDGAMLLVLLGPGLFAVGHLTGWYLGYETRFDFLPFFLRALLTTLVLMPLAHWGRLRLHEATRRRSENTLVGVIFGVVGFVAAACFWTFVSPGLFDSAAVESATLVAALVVSHAIYRRMLTTYYRTADLA